MIVAPRSAGLIRAAIWCIAFLPLVVAMLAPVAPQVKGWIVVYVEVPFLLGAILVEVVYLRSKKRPVTGPVGNRLAVVLSAALLVMVAAWVVWQFN